MRRIIDYKIYDTDKATKITETYIFLDAPPYCKRIKELYKTEKGGWFLYCSNSVGRAQPEIVPLDPHEAYRFLEDLQGDDGIDTNLLLEHFGSQIKEA